MNSFDFSIFLTGASTMTNALGISTQTKEQGPVFSSRIAAEIQMGKSLNRTKIVSSTKKVYY